MNKRQRKKRDAKLTKILVGIQRTMDFTSSIALRAFPVIPLGRRDRKA